jgi:hypothetical protein
VFTRIFRWHRLIAVVCTLLVAPGGAFDLLAQQQPAAAPATSDAPKLTEQQLDSLVSPIALYPDPLLSQVLVASTYPLEIAEASQWLAQNTGKKPQDLVDLAKKQDWDASIQAMVAFPDLLKRLANDIKWTTDLGNAFLAQQSDVMDSVQRMRAKAKDAGKLESNQQQKVSTKTEESKTIIEVQPANPQVIYVPAYNPTVVWGPPPYPYPPIYYPPPPSTGAIIAASVVSFGVGVAVGAMFSGGWGWGCGWGWGHNTVVINNNYFVHNNFNYNRNINVNQNINVNRNINQNINRNTWTHDPSHRAGVPYGNSQVAQQYHGLTAQQRGTAAGRQQAAVGAQQQLQRQNLGGASRNPSGGGFNRPEQGNLGGNRGGGGERMGNRDFGQQHSHNGAFSGVGSNRTRAESSLGHSSMNSARSRGFGGFGGFHGGGGGFRGRR